MRARSIAIGLSVWLCLCQQALCVWAQTDSVLAPRSMLAKDFKQAEQAMRAFEKDKRIFRALRMFLIGKSYDHPFYVMLGKYFIRVSLAQDKKRPMDELGPSVYCGEWMGEEMDYFPKEKWPLIEPFLIRVHFDRPTPSDVPSIYCMDYRSGPIDLAKRRVELETQTAINKIKTKAQSPQADLEKIDGLCQLIRNNPPLQVRDMAIKELTSYIAILLDRRVYMLKLFQKNGFIPTETEPDGLSLLALEVLLRMESLVDEGTIKIGEFSGPVMVAFACLAEARRYLGETIQRDALRFALGFSQSRGAFDYIPGNADIPYNVNDEIADPVTRALAFCMDWNDHMRARLKDIDGWDSFAGLQGSHSMDLTIARLAQWTGDATVFLEKEKVLASANKPLASAALIAILQIVHGKIQRWIEDPNFHLKATLREEIKDIFIGLAQIPEKRVEHWDFAEKSIAKSLMQLGERSLALMMQIKRDPGIAKDKKLEPLFEDIFDRIVESAPEDTMPAFMVILLQDVHAAPSAVARLMRQSPSLADFQNVRAALLRKELSADVRLRILEKLREGVSPKNISFVFNLLEFLCADPSKKVRELALSNLEDLPVIEQAHAALVRLDGMEESVLSWMMPGSLAWAELSQLFVAYAKQGKEKGPMQERLLQWMKENLPPEFQAESEIQKAMGQLLELYGGMLEKIKATKLEKVPAPTAVDKGLRALRKMETAL